MWGDRSRQGTAGQRERETKENSNSVRSLAEL